MSHLRLALVEKLHCSDEDDSKTPKKDKDLVPIVIFGSVVGWEKHHCRALAGLI
jgi:hypothetical protein